MFRQRIADEFAELTEPGSGVNVPTIFAPQAKTEGVIELFEVLVPVARLLILHELGEYLGYSPPPRLERPIEDAQKIHQQRPILQETLATATQLRCES